MKAFWILALCLGLSGCITTSNNYHQIAEDYIAVHPDISEQTKIDIRGGTIRTGMTREEIKASWADCGILLDYPQTKTCSAFGCMEIYHCHKTYLNFTNDKLTSLSQFNY